MSKYKAVDAFLQNAHYSNDGESFTDFMGNKRSLHMLQRSGFSIWTWDERRGDYTS